MVHAALFQQYLLHVIEDNLKGVSIIMHDENVSGENREFVSYFQNSMNKVVDKSWDLEIATMLCPSCMPAFIALSLDLFAVDLKKGRYNLFQKKKPLKYLQTLNSTYILKEDILLT